MKRYIILVVTAAVIVSLCGCTGSQPQAQVAATTLPVYEFTQYLCNGTDITVSQLISENVSCLHDYTLQVSQMRILESADMIICSGAGLEEFMHDILQTSSKVIDASEDIALLCGGHDHEHTGVSEHSHSHDPHIWLSPLNAKTMAGNICSGLCEQFPQHQQTIRRNLNDLESELDALYQYGLSELSAIPHRELITFHDGFAYFAESFGLSILHAVEEESGGEASAAELIHLIEMITIHDLPAIFTEVNGSTAAASIVAKEAGVPVFTLDMAISSDSYFDAMYHNINVVKEALG